MKYRQQNCDLLVVGAGASGVSAAVAAARNEVSVILLEQNKFPGGTAVIARHNFICGVDRSRKGLLKEILSRIAPNEKLIKRGKVSILPFKTEQMVLALTRIIKSEKRIKVFYNCKAISVKRAGKRIVSVSAKKGDSKMLIKPKIVIDASGEGELIKLSKAKYKISGLSKRQLSGFSFLVKQIKGENTLLAWKVPYYLRQGFKSKRLPEYSRLSLFSPADLPGEGFIRVNLVAAPQNRGEKETNKQAVIIHNYLRKVLPEFEKSYIAYVSPCLCNREGVRLLGEYTLSKEDVLVGRKFPDAVASGSWPIEFWHRNGPVFTYLKENSFYEIPLRSLKSKDIVNLFAAGRCISADADALASTRVLGTCISLGEAAGIAASKLCASF